MIPGGGFVDMKCRLALGYILLSSVVVFAAACSSGSGQTSGTGGSGAGGSMEGTGGVLGIGGTTHTGIWNVMLLGDSVTASTCYSQLTYPELQAGKHTQL